MKEFCYPALFTLLAIGAASAMLPGDEYEELGDLRLLRTDEFDRPTEERIPIDIRTLDGLGRDLRTEDRHERDPRTEERPGGVPRTEEEYGSDYEDQLGPTLIRTVPYGRDLRTEERPGRELRTEDRLERDLRTEERPGGELRTEDRHKRDPRTNERLGRDHLPTQKESQSQSKDQLPNSLSFRLDIKARPTIDKRLADLLEAQSQLRSEIEKAQLQQNSQRQLIRNIDNLIQSQAQFQTQLKKLRISQVKRLDRSSAQRPKIPERRIITRVLLL